MKKIHLLVVLSVGLGLTIFLFLNHFRPQTAFSPQGLSQVTFILDAGHGGEDGGAVSPSGLLESQINLDIGLKMEQILVLYGYPPVMIRREDISIYDEGMTTLHEKKVSDIRNRVDLVQSTEGGVLVSIHQNSYQEMEYHGFQVFYAQTAESSELATQVQWALLAGVDGENQRENKEISQDIYLMNHIDCPGILVECGFLSNSTEEALLQTDAYQKKIAASIAGGLITWEKGRHDTNEGNI